MLVYHFLAKRNIYVNFITFLGVDVKQILITNLFPT